MTEYRVNVLFSASSTAEASRCVKVESDDIEGAISAALSAFKPEEDALAVNITDEDGYEVWDNSSDESQVSISTPLVGH
jgi:hypothetical protein